MFSNYCYQNRPLSEKAIAYSAKQARAEATMRARVQVKRNEYMSDPKNMELVAKLLEAGRNDEGFLGSLLYAFNKFGSLTEKQEDALAHVLNKREAQAAQRVVENAANAGSEYVGEVGQRQNFEVHVERTFNFEGHYGTCYCYLLKDAAGNIIVNMGSCLEGVEKGQSLKIKGTVKKHEVRDGVKQTVVNRVKVL